MKQRTRPWALIKVTHWAYAYTKASPSPGCKTKATLCQTSLLLRHTLLLHCTSYVFSCRVFAAPDIAAPTLYVIRCTSYVVRHAYSVAVHLQHLRSWLTRRLCKCHSLTYLNCNESFSQTKSCCSSNLCRMHTQGHWQMCAVAYI